MGTTAAAAATPMETFSGSASAAYTSATSLMDSIDAADAAVAVTTLAIASHASAAVAPKTPPPRSGVSQTPRPSVKACLCAQRECVRIRKCLPPDDLRGGVVSIPLVQKAPKVGDLPTRWSYLSALARSHIASHFQLNEQELEDLSIASHRPRIARWHFPQQHLHRAANGGEQRDCHQWWVEGEHTTKKIYLLLESTIKKNTKQSHRKKIGVGPPPVVWTFAAPIVKQDDMLDELGGRSAVMSAITPRFSLASSKKPAASASNKRPAASQSIAAKGNDRILTQKRQVGADHSSSVEEAVLAEDEAPRTLKQALNVIATLQQTKTYLEKRIENLEARVGAIEHFI